MATAATIGGISVAIVATLAVLAEERLMVAAWVVAALALMGVFLGALALRKKD